ncbi:hypothetical protein ACFQGT_14730 [Natrialbaceae archaeon GCM10025810]|uniref:hypothetical protein n=1 Tax=Halovalidus salilacus TaxID=3075124 RepID=UPI003614D145
MNVPGGRFANRLQEFTPDDRGYEWLLLAGPAVVVVLAVLGRSPAAVAVAVAYLVAFVSYVLYRALEGD